MELDKQDVEKETIELIEEVNKKEEKIQSLEQKIKENNKRISHIEKSNTWKTANVFHKLKLLFIKFLGLEKAYEKHHSIVGLENELIHKEQEMLKMRETVHELTLKDLEINRNLVYQFVRDLKDKGELNEYLDRFIKDKEKVQNNYKEAIVYAARLYENKEEVYKNILYSKILSGLTIEEIPEFIVRAGLSENSIPLHQAASFRGSLNMRIRKKQLQDLLPEWELDDKRRAYYFASKIGLKTPEVDENHYTLDAIPARDGIVIKPVNAAGARGVYLVHARDDIYDVRNSINLTNWDDMKSSMQKDLDSGAVTEDDWMIEKLIYENMSDKIAARDVKFYCFYGKVGLILEIVREPEIRHCWWMPNGERISTGKYDESLFSGIGVTDEEIRMAEKVSKKIPAPFIRIDFLREENGLVLGEFTPKPGNYDEFNQRLDQKLGDYFLAAEAKLINDLLNGKEFEEFMAFKNEVEHTLL